MEENNRTISDEILGISMDIKKYQLSEPYPNVAVTKEDKGNLKVLFQDYSSRESELTSVNQYVYSHMAINKEGKLEKEIGDAFEGIGIIEMFHLELLGDIIYKIGGEPKFINNKGVYWKSNFIPYGKDIKEKIKFAIVCEENAIKNYDNGLKLLENKGIKLLYKRIIKDEELHLEIFKKLLKKLSKA